MFLFMTYYLQQTLGYSALKTGVAYLPFSGRHRRRPPGSRPSCCPGSGRGC